MEAKLPAEPCGKDMDRQNEIRGTLQWFSRYAPQNSKVLLSGCLGVARGWGPEREEDINGYAFGSLIHL